MQQPLNSCTATVSGSLLQVTGEATYTDDMQLTKDALIGVCVTSTKPHARIVSVDTSKALAIPGVVGYYGSKDVPGSNMIGPVVADEEVYASDIVTAVGQVRTMLGTCTRTFEAHVFDITLYSRDMDDRAITHLPSE